MARKRVKGRKGDSVKIHYICKLADGTVIDSSSGKEPLEFTLGKGEVIKALEDAVMGMGVGQSKTVNVPAENAYGPHRGEWVLNMGRDKLTEGFNPEVGLDFEIPRGKGQSSKATVTHVSQSSVTLDFNHPLAGKALIFEISFLEIIS
ncbi:MAG: peptidylprolyl isomerase [Nitrospira sp.]|nr:peptidylprolyl isomerase [Nitrospira sp.]